MNSIYRTSHTYKSIEVFQFTPRYQHVNLKELFIGVKIKYSLKIFILLYFNSLIGSFAIKPKLLMFKAAARLRGPELLPTKKSEFFKARITPVRSFWEQLIKNFFWDKLIIFSAI